MKTSELTGPALDWAVAKAEGLNPYAMVEKDHGKQRPLERWCAVNICLVGRDVFSPSTDWSQGGPILDRENICVMPPVVRRIGPEKHAFPVDHWRAMKQQDENEVSIHTQGNTALIASMRCYVTSKLGADVDIPKELIK